MSVENLSYCMCEIIEGQCFFTELRIEKGGESVTRYPTFA